VPYIDDTYTGIVRFDCVVADGKIKILELNADYPDGLLLHDKTYGLLAGSPCQVHESAFLSYFPPKTMIHISHAKEAYFLDAYYTEAATLEAAGHTVSLGAGAPPHGTPAWHRRCIEASKVTTDDMLWCKDARPQHLNSFALRTLGYKDLLASVSHPYALKTSPVGREMFPELTAHQSGYVLKPANGCEGRGIFFGRNHTKVAWADILATLPPGYIAQEYVQLPRRRVAIYDGGTVVEKELYFDICPHFFITAGTVTGTGHLLMPFSESPVVNVAQGGAVGYHTLT